MNYPAQPHSREHALLALLVAAATLTGCASGERMIRVSPFSGVSPEAGQNAGDAQTARLRAKNLTDDRINAFPLYYAAAGTTIICWPLIDSDKDGWAVRPFYNRDHDNESILFPLSGWDKSSGWVLNTVWDDKQGRMFAPFFGKWNNTRFVFPVFLTDQPDGSTAVRVFPVWYSDSEEWRIELLYSEKHDKSGTEREALLGLLYDDRISASGEVRRLWAFPFAYHNRAKSSSEWITLPLSYGEDSRHSWMNIHPFWWSSKGEGWSSETLLPVWHRTTVGENRKTFTPFAFTSTGKDSKEVVNWLYSYGNNPDESWFNIHPVWWNSRTGDNRSQLLVPFYYKAKNADSSGIYTLLGFHEQKGTEYENTVTWIHSRGRQGNSRWDNIHPLRWTSENEYGSSDLLLPLYWHSHDGKIETTYTPLGMHETIGADSRWVTLPFSAGNAGTREWLNIHPLWWSSHSEKESMSALFPLYYTRKDANSSATYTMIGAYERDGNDISRLTLPYSSGHVGDRSWFNIHPFWWSSDSPNRSVRALLPVYYSAREGDSTEGYSWLGYHSAKGEDSRWLTLPFSAGRAGERSWLNIHPLWWSSAEGERRTRTLFPFWSSLQRADGSGRVITPLGFSESDTRGNTVFFNALGIGYQWKKESESTTSNHLLWPLYSGRHSTGEVDRNFMGRLSFAAHETAANVDSLRITPLWSYANGPGPTPVRDWLHLTSRRTNDGETTTTATPLIAITSNKADGRWRITPIAASAELADDTTWRDWLHLISFRSDERARSITFTPLCETRSTHAGGEFRLTPVLDCGTGRYAPMTPWSPHLFTYGEADGKRHWSFTPLIGNIRTPEAESTRFWPFYNHEIREGRTVSRMAFPFYAGGEVDSFPDVLCAVHHVKNAKGESTSVLGPVWTHEIFHLQAEPNERALFETHGNEVEITNHLFSTDKRYIHLSVDKTIVSEAEKSLIREWCDNESRMRTLEKLRLAPNSPAAKEIRLHWNGGTEASMIKLHGGVVDFLRRHNAVPDHLTVDAMKTSLAGIAAKHARREPGYRYAFDPLGINFYRESREPGKSSWSFLFGLGEGKWINGYGEASVLGYLYTKEISPDGVRMNCFPFIQRDETVNRRKVAFLWRVWNRETDNRTGEVHGHVFFIPY